MDVLFNQPYLLAAAAAFGVALLGVVLLNHRRLRSASTQENLDWSRIQAFRGEDYRPLERLMNPDDYSFLQRQPGYQPELAARLRRERRQIFRSYLRRLESDFDQLHRLARTLVRDQSQDSPELAMALVRTDLTFRWNLATIRFRLLLQAAHVNVAALRPVDSKGLVDAAVWMQAQIRLLNMPVASAAAAG
jgi:hypothetical protein